MARVLGEAGRYLSDVTLTKTRRMIGWIVGCVAFCEFLLGMLVGLGFARVLGAWLVVFATLALVTVGLAYKVAVRQIGALEKERANARRGSVGEAVVGRKLAELPDEYFVIHDVSTGAGNVDHVVVGPSGVFLLDAKSWRGTVTADGKGELLLNGKAGTTRHVDRFIKRLMDVRARIHALAPECDSYYQGVFVFTAARVEARFGDTGAVHCIRDEQAVGYIVGDKNPRRLKAVQVDALARAFGALARMEDGFDG